MHPSILTPPTKLCGMVAKQDICWSFLWCLEEVNLLVFSALLIPGRLLFSWVSYSFHSLLCSAFSTKGNCVSVSPLSTVFIIHGSLLAQLPTFWIEGKANYFDSPLDHHALDPEILSSKAKITFCFLEVQIRTLHYWWSPSQQSIAHFLNFSHIE